MKVKMKYVVLPLISTVVIFLDQLTKYWTVSRFKLGETLTVIPGFFSITYIQNKGAAFGLLSSADPSFRIPFFLIVPIVALLSIGYVFLKLSEKDIRLAIALSLVIAGAIGNLIDRLNLGYVVDFLDFHWQWRYHFPAFNVADSAICIGVGLIMLDLFVQEGNSKKEGSQVNVSPSL